MYLGNQFWNYSIQVLDRFVSDKLMNKDFTETKVFAYYFKNICLFNLVQKYTNISVVNINMLRLNVI